MNKGNPQFTSWTYEGDIAEATKWLPYAVGMLKSCAKRAVVRHTETPANGVMITVDATTGRVHIKAGGLVYLESGFYTFDTLGYTADKLPVGFGANCHYNSAVTSHMASDDPDQGKMAIKSSPMPEAVLSGEHLPSGFRSRSFNYVSGEPEEGAELLHKYRAMMRVPSSVFSGKLKLFIQAKYGSVYNDISYIAELPFELPMLRWGKAVISAGMPGVAQSGIYTTDDYDYFLMQVGANSVLFTELEPLPKVKGLIDKLRNGFFDDGQDRAHSLKTKAEAVVLAHLSLTEKEYTVEWDQSSGYIPYYGWHFTWDGHKGHAVKTSIEPYSGMWANRFTLCELQINHARNRMGEHVFTIEEQIKETKYTANLNSWLAFCYPFPAESKLINACYYNWYPTIETPFATINSASNVPLYCYLDDSDELQVVRITYDLQSKTGVVNNNNPNSVCYPNSRQYIDIKTYNGLSGTVQLSINGASEGGQWLKTTNEANYYNEPSGAADPWGTWDNDNVFISRYLCNGTFVQTYLENSGYFNIFGNGMVAGTFTQYCSGIPQERPYLYTVRTRGAQIIDKAENFPSGREESFFVTCIIPYDDCSAVFLASKQHKRARTVSKGQKTVPVGVVEMQVGYGNYLCDNNTFVNVNENVDGPLPLLWGTADTGINLITSTEPASFTERFGVHRNGQYTLLKTETGGLTGSEFPGTIGNYDYFYFGLDDLFIEHPDSIKSSITDGYKLITGYSGSEDGEYPGSTSVGWA